MNQASLELWEKRIDDRKSSGLNVSEWCAKNNLTKHAYYYWKKRIELINKDEADLNNTLTFGEFNPTSELTGIVQESLQISWNDFNFSISNTQTAILAAEFISQLQKRC